ncbi:uncharacterized protein METZ01_LOCUS161697, partial [marine metagenome]
MKPILLTFIVVALVAGCGVEEPSSVKPPVKALSEGQVAEVPEAIDAPPVAQAKEPPPQPRRPVPRVSISIHEAAAQGNIEIVR